MESNFDEMEKLIFNTLEKARFDEEGRLLDLFNIFIAKNEESINQNGHVLAMNSAASSLNPYSATAFQMSGLQMLNQSKQAITKIKNSHDATFILNNLHTSNL